MNMPTTAIVILNYNGQHWLQKFLPTVLLHSEGAEVYVIDNASTDGTISYLALNFPTVRVVQNIENYGFAGGYNEGLRHITADIYCLLNSDVEVTARWLEPVLSLFEKDPAIAAVQPKILDYNRRHFFEFAGAGGGLIDNLGYPYCRGRVFDALEKDQGQYDDETEIFWASGCAFFIRAADFWQQGGFDARFFAHQEEIDLCWRLRNAGRKIYYTGQSAVYHVGGGTLSKQSARKTFLNFRNNLSMMLKNLPLLQLFPLIFFRLCLDGVAAVFIGLKSGLPHLWAVAQAHFAFYRDAPETWRRRGHHQQKYFYQDKWLIFKYFLFGKGKP